MKRVRAFFCGLRGHGAMYLIALWCPNHGVRFLEHEHPTGYRGEVKFCPKCRKVDKEYKP